MPTTRPTPNKGGRCRMLGHLWNRALAHYRTETVRNDMGGLDEQRIRLGVIAARVPQPTALERVMARSQVGPQQGQAELTQPVYCDPGEDVRRGDELVDETTGEVFRVVAAIRPSVAVYLRLDTEVLQAEPAGEVS